MEGKNITTSILPLAIDLREIERWRSKKTCKKTLGAGTPLLLMKVARKSEKEEDSSLYRQQPWVPQLKNPIGLKHRSMGFGRIRRRRENRSSKFLVSKKYIFHEFGDIENSIQILCKKIVFFFFFLKSKLVLQFLNKITR